MAIASKLLITTGLIFTLISLAVLFQRNNPNRLSFNIDENIQHEAYLEKSEAEARLVRIKSVGIENYIFPAEFGESWETTSEGVSHITSSPLPGNRGNAIIYGHNWGNILGNLGSVQVGDEVEIILENGKTRRFYISTIQEVSPQDISVLKQTSDIRLTIYTCTGLFDQKRLVVTAFPASS